MSKAKIAAFIAALRFAQKTGVGYPAPVFLFQG
jgi:hypothetical protein